ncbi:hypothetical protein KY285_009971 [Solanum tuberosum]|nr:hypothetical protein KY285_009971 [Solanum tuberosum]
MSNSQRIIGIRNDSQPESEDSQPESEDSQPESELLFDDQEANTEEKEEDAILLGYFKTRIHRVADGVNNPTETEEICAICQAGFEHEESIGHLGVDTNIIQVASNNGC